MPSSFARKKIQKYGDRRGYETFLREKVAADIAKVRLHRTEEATQDSATSDGDTPDTRDLGDIDD